MNSINSVKDIEMKLKKLYFYGSIKNTLSFKKYLEYCKRYFKALKLAKGMNCAEISSVLNVSPYCVRSWIKGGRKPYLLHYAELFPNENLPQNYKFLPLKNGRHNKSEFIKVPIQITSYSDILYVIKQLNQRSGITTPEKLDAFFYLIGILISDGFSQKQLRTYSTRFSLVLSKKYKWSYLLGKNVCHYLNIIGMRAYSGKDIPIKDRNPNGSFLWYSENSPLFTWIKKTCLGLDNHQITKNTSVQIRWILKCPQKYRVALIQGLADGDGSASLTDWRIQIRTKVNTESIRDILSSLDIKSRITEGKVVVSKYDHVIKAVELPIFRFAESRKENNQKIKSLILKRNKNRAIPDYNLIKFLFDLHKRGFTFPQINSEIYDKFNISFNPIHLRDMMRKDVKNYDVNNEIVMRYFDVLENSIKNKNVPKHTPYNTVYDWIHKGRVPIDVKRKLSLGYKPDKLILDKFDHLKRFMVQ